MIVNSELVVHQEVGGRAGGGPACQPVSSRVALSPRGHAGMQESRGSVGNERQVLEEGHDAGGNSLILTGTPFRQTVAPSYSKRLMTGPGQSLVEPSLKSVFLCYTP